MEPLIIKLNGLAAVILNLSVDDVLAVTEVDNLLYTLIPIGNRQFNIIVSALSEDELCAVLAQTSQAVVSSRNSLNN